VIVRDATDEEREPLRAILGNSYRDAFHHSSGAPLEEAELVADAAIRSWLAAPVAYPWLLRVAAVNGHRPLGALFGAIAKQTRLVTIIHVWIDPAAEDADGIGRLLLADVDAFAAAEGAIRIQFAVLLSDDRVHRVCEAAGYAVKSVALTKRLQPDAE
jgi:hypothetical protein